MFGSWPFFNEHLVIKLGFVERLWFVEGYFVLCCLVLENLFYESRKVNERRGIVLSGTT